jgi:hypothetical protein
MFCVTPEKKNRFFVSCNDRDFEKLKVLVECKISNDDIYVVLEICSMLEKKLEDIVKEEH